MQQSVEGVESHPVLLGIAPFLGPANGSSLVRISGVTLQFGSLYQCRFGESLVPASYERSSGNVRCHTPAHAPGAVALAITLNGEHFEPTRLQSDEATRPRDGAIGVDEELPRRKGKGGDEPN